MSGIISFTFPNSAVLLVHGHQRTQDNNIAIGVTRSRISELRKLWVKPWIEILEACVLLSALPLTVWSWENGIPFFLAPVFPIQNGNLITLSGVILIFRILSLFRHVCSLMELCRFGSFYISVALETQPFLSVHGVTYLCRRSVSPFCRYQHPSMTEVDCKIALFVYSSSFPL